MSYTAPDLPFEITKIEGDNITPSKLIWRRYKRPALGIVEIFEDMNPQILDHLATSPFLPVGQIVRIPIDSSILAGNKPSLKQVKVF